MNSKKWIPWISRKILLACRKVFVCVDFSPEPICNRVLRLFPSMELAGNITTNFNPHPAPAVVINAVGRLVGITGGEGVAHHRVPLLRKVTPLLRPCRHTDKDRPDGATLAGER